MIIRNNGMSPEEFQKQVDSMTKMKRGFNQSPKDLQDGTNLNPMKPKNPNSSMDSAIDLRKKISNMKSGSRKWN